MTKREMVCVSCITVELDDNNEVISVTGNTCPRGDKYARQECTHPERMLTSTVKVEGGRLPVVPVKSASPIPKEMLFDAMKEVNKVTLKAPVTFGDVAVKDILGTGIDIVVTNEA